MPKGNPNPKNQFQPGVVTNPNGRKSLVKILQEKLEKESPSGKSKYEQVCEALITLATTKKDIRAIKEIFDRIEGAPVQQVNVNANVNYDNLTVEELKQLKELTEKTQVNEES